MELHGVFVCVCGQRIDTGTQDKEQTISWLEYSLCLLEVYRFSSSVCDLSSWSSRKPVDFALMSFTRFIERRHSDVRKFAYH